MNFKRIFSLVLIFSLQSTLIAHPYTLNNRYFCACKPTIMHPSFKPTLENLNTITLTQISDKPTELQPITISELTGKIYTNYKTIKDGTFLAIKDNDVTKKYCQIFKGIPKTDEKKFLTIHSRGFAREDKPNGDAYYKKMINCFFPAFQVRGLPKKGGGALCGYIAIRDNFIHTPCITFDYPDRKNLINLSQNLDLACLDTIIHNVPSDYSIVCFGTSRGATTLLKHELLNKSEKHPYAMILESPFLSMKDMVAQLLSTSLYYIPYAQSLAFAIFQWLFPGYKVQEDNLEQLLSNMNSTTAILIVHLKGDPYISDKGMFAIVSTLAKKNDNVHLLVVHDTTKKLSHGRLSTVTQFQKTANAFMEKYGIPHDEMLADKGKALLTVAQKNAKATSPNDWEVISIF